MMAGSMDPRSGKQRVPSSSFWSLLAVLTLLSLELFAGLRTVCQAMESTAGQVCLCSDAAAPCASLLTILLSQVQWARWDPE